MLAGIDSNAVVQFLGNQDVGVQYLKDAVLFLFCLGVVKGAGRKGLISTLGTSFLRAFGDVNIALALGLGGMPGAVFKNLDNAMWILGCAVFWAWYCDAHVPREIASYWGHAQSLSTCIIKAHNAAAGYAAAAIAIPGSFWAPIFGAYVAVNGARLIESGVSAVSKRDSNSLLAEAAGIWIWLFTTHLQASALGAQALLAAWAFSGNWVNWRGQVDSILANFGAGGKRGKTPASKKK